MWKTISFLLIGLTICLSESRIGFGQEVQEKFLSEGVTRRVGGYRPLRAEMDQEASIIQKAPVDDLENPKYGFLTYNDSKWAFVMDEPEEKPARLFIDTNADGDLTNDPAAKWEAQKQGEFNMYSGNGTVDLGSERLGNLGLYRFDPKDESRAALKNTLMYYIDFGTEYSFHLDGKEFSTFVSGILQDGQKLPIDRDGNGRASRHFEMATLNEPFNFTGTTYEFSLSDGKLGLSESKNPVDMTPMPPDLRLGKPALAFTAKTMNGTEIDFPKHFAGKIVMLDFWATWCGPCVAEIPNMKKAYAEYHDKGFEILGISFDQKDMEEKLAEFLKENELPWEQIYEGKYWETSFGKMHDVSGIPFVLLVDGDSGTILGTSKELRGEGLAEYIGKQLEIKNGAPAGGK